MPAPSRDITEESHCLPAAVIVMLAASGLFALAAQTVLQNRATATMFVSGETWQRIVPALGGTIVSQPNGQLTADLNLGPLFLAVLSISFGAWFAGAFWISQRSGRAMSLALGDWGTFGWLWGIFAGSWELARIAAFSLGLSSLEILLLSTPHFWFALSIGGWLATLLTFGGSEAHHSLAPGPSPARGEGKKNLVRAKQEGDSAAAIELFDYRIPLAVWVLMGAYVVVFTAMNWQLYFGLLLPHGDSAMYEEHLWNFAHGKGFRSYLDQGLFLGEHVQFVHLFLLPLHFLWPSHLLLELCQSLILAAGAVPVFWLARRHSGSASAGICLAAAYLLYFPLQYLDIAIDLKTFRPNALGVPIVLFALDQFERHSVKAMIAWLLLTLTCQEDWAIVLACFGAWIALRAWLSPGSGVRGPESDAGEVPSGMSRVQGSNAESSDAKSEARSPKPALLLGLGIAVFNAVYLVLATRVIILWFRNWVEIHYAGYFTKFGHGLTEVVWNMATKPGLLYQELFVATTATYLLAVLLPLGFVPLLSPGRLAIGMPVFITLCLNEVSRAPQHHFHAPIVPFVFWAAAAGLGNIGRVRRWIPAKFSGSAQPTVDSDRRSLRFAAHLTWTCSFATGLFFSLSPLGLSFWDPGSQFYWRNLYVPGKRAEMAERVVAKIPPTARVASTDFIHPRFTHYERSYDYSDYPRAVSNYEKRVPDDTDYIVIDMQHPYSVIKSPGEVRELSTGPENLQPGQWELLPDDTDGYFIVLKRKQKPPRNE